MHRSAITVWRGDLEDEKFSLKLFYKEQRSRSPKESSQLEPVNKASSPFHVLFTVAIGAGRYGVETYMWSVRPC